MLEPSIDMMFLQIEHFVIQETMLGNAQGTVYT